jgi:hypothetical protein
MITRPQQPGEHRFAVTRCWSEGDLNCRSSLGLLTLGERPVSRQVSALIFFKTARSSRHTRRPRSQTYLFQCDEKLDFQSDETAGSNPPRSSKESMRTAGLVDQRDRPAPAPPPFTSRREDSRGRRRMFSLRKVVVGWGWPTGRQERHRLPAAWASARQQTLNY